MASDAAENLYRVGQWLEGPDTEAGQARYRSVRMQMVILREHPYIQAALQHKKIRILDLCGGWGAAGVAFAENLKEAGIPVSLTILDLRRDMKPVAEAFGEKRLGAPPEFLVGDAEKLEGLWEPYDVALLWGESAIHFNPWELTRLVAGASNNLFKGGVLALEEVDRPYTTFLQSGYQRMLVEGASESKAVISLHSGYDARRGTFSRVNLDLVNGRRAAEELYYWGFASVAQLCWMFFKEVDLIPLDKSRGIILAANPRRAFEASAFDADPRILQKTP